MCNVVDACDGLDIDAVIQAACRQMHPGSSGEHGLLSNTPQLWCGAEVSVLSCVNACTARLHYSPIMADRKSLALIS